jgi:cytochrome c-type biogenesis protein CcmE
MSRKTAKTVIAAAVIAAAVAYLLYETTKSSWIYYYSVDEFVEKYPQNTLQTPENSAKINNRIIRLAGQIKDGSIINNAENSQLDFILAGQKNLVPVRYYGAVPNNFAAGKEIIAEGKIGADGTFRANLILTRCESKYKAKLYQNKTGP